MVCWPWASQMKGLIIIFNLRPSLMWSDPNQEWKRDEEQGHQKWLPRPTAHRLLHITPEWREIETSLFYTKVKSTSSSIIHRKHSFIDFGYPKEFHHRENCGLWDFHCKIASKFKTHIAPERSEIETSLFYTKVKNTSSSIIYRKHGFVDGGLWVSKGLHHGRGAVGRGSHFWCPCYSSLCHC